LLRVRTYVIRIMKRISDILERGFHSTELIQGDKQNLLRTKSKINEKNKKN
jgi:hypothetical protein